MVNSGVIRQQSLAAAERLGYPINQHLPLLEVSDVVRSVDDIVDRVLGMLCVAACAYGFGRQEAREWLEWEARANPLTASEATFLRGKGGNRHAFMEQIEGMWVLSWSVRIIADLDLGKPCSQDFVSLLPDLKGNNSSALFRRNAKLRRREEIVSACDLAYCLHWAIRQCELQRAKIPGDVEPYVIVERRRALEWLLTATEWSQLTLDT